MADFDCDLFVIGGGSGGVRAARIAAGYGARVLLAEEYRLGGTCVIRGCVPKKLLVLASRFSHDFEEAAGFGWTVEGASFDWPTLISNKDKEIARLEAAYAANLTRANVLKQATSLKGFHSPYFLDGITYSYTPDDYTPMKTLYISVFNGKDWDISDRPVTE